MAAMFQVRKKLHHSNKELRLEKNPSNRVVSSNVKLRDQDCYLLFIYIKLAGLGRASSAARTRLLRLINTQNGTLRATPPLAHVIAFRGD